MQFVPTHMIPLENRLGGKVSPSADLAMRQAAWKRRNLEANASRSAQAELDENYRDYDRLVGESF